MRMFAAISVGLVVLCGVQFAWGLSDPSALRNAEIVVVMIFSKASSDEGCNIAAITFAALWFLGLGKDCCVAAIDADHRPTPRP